jgi:hypothetical protein
MAELPLPTDEEQEIARWPLPAQSVREYLQAVGDASPIYEEKGVVPPTAVAASAIGALLRKLSLPPGALHTSQELEFLGAARFGEEMACTARIVQAGSRGGWRFLTLQFSVSRPGGGAVLRGRSAVMIPLEEGRR